MYFLKKSCSLTRFLRKLPHTKEGMMKIVKFSILAATAILIAAAPCQAGGGRHGSGGGYHGSGGGGHHERHHEHHHHGGHWWVWGRPSYITTYPVGVPYYAGPPQETVIVVPAPVPQRSMGQPTFGVNCLGPWCKKDQPAPQMADQQGSQGPQLVTPPPQPRLRQVNVDTATLMKKARIEHHTYGKTLYPDDLRPGEAVVICNAASGPYILESESQYKGHSYHKQQCWRYDNPLDGSPVEEEVFVK